MAKKKLVLKFFLSSPRTCSLRLRLHKLCMGRGWIFGPWIVLENWPTSEILARNGNSIRTLPFWVWPKQRLNYFSIIFSDISSASFQKILLYARLSAGKNLSKKRDSTENCDTRVFGLFDKWLERCSSCYSYFSSYVVNEYSSKAVMFILQNCFRPQQI